MITFTEMNLENHYLANAAPADVLLYLKQKMIERKEGAFLSDEGQRILFDRNELLTDVALVQLVSTRLVDDVLDRATKLERNQSAPIIVGTPETSIERYEQVLVSALGGPNVDGLVSAPRWLERLTKNEFSPITLKNLPTLLFNPSCPVELLVDALEKRNAFASLDGESYRPCLYAALSNKRLSKEKDRFQFDSAYHELSAACWKLLITLDVNEANISLLVGTIPNFPELSLDDDHCTLLEEKYPGLRLTNVNKEAKYVRLMCQKWHLAMPGKYLWFESVAHVLIQKMRPYSMDKLEGFVLKVVDPVVTRAYYSRASLTGLDESAFEKRLGKLGVSFIEGLIENQDIYVKKGYKKVARLVLNFLDHYEAPSGLDYHDTPKFAFNANLERFAKKDHLRYFASRAEIYFDEPDEDSKRKLLEEQLSRIKENIDTLSKSADGYQVSAKDLTQLFDLQMKRLALLEETIKANKESQDAALEVLNEKISNLPGIHGSQINFVSVLVCIVLAVMLYLHR
jgi:hypothetical protein